MNRIAITFFAVLGGFVGGFILSEIIVRTTVVWFGGGAWLASFGFFPIVLPFAGAALGFWASRRKGGSAP